MAAQKKWTVRRRGWPNGRVYFVVGRGKSEFVAGQGGGISKYYDKDQAKGIAGEMNGKPRIDNNPVIEDF